MAIDLDEAIAHLKDKLPDLIAGASACDEASECLREHETLLELLEELKLRRERD